MSESETSENASSPMPIKHCSTPPPPLSDETLLVKVSRKVPSDSLLDADYRCCCGTFHVERGAYWIAVVGIALCALSLVPTVYNYSWATVVSAMVSIAIYGGILVAQSKQEPLWYLPYIINQVIGLILFPIYIVACVVVMVYMKEVFEHVIFKFSKPEDFAPYTEGQLIMAGRMAVGIFIGMLVLCAALGIWLLSVVWRAYKFMKMSNQARCQIRYA